MGGASGPNVNGFEKDLEEFVNHPDVGRMLSKKVVALSAGTAAIHLALVNLGVKAGDEVICQSFTFAASANPVTYQGATPVFVDSEPIVEAHAHATSLQGCSSIRQWCKRSVVQGWIMFTQWPHGHR